MLSVIIPCASHPELLVEQLDALAAMTCPEPWEVVVVDNGLAPDEQLEEQFRRFARLLPSFRVVTALDGKGAGFARNVGVAASRGDKLAFLDADDVAGEGWLEAMSRALDEHALVASRWDIDLLNDEVARSARKNGQADGVRSYTRPRYLDHAGGCGLGVLRAAFNEVGGFDERYRLLEDTDLTWRLQLAGYRLAFAPDAIVHIRFRPSSQGSFRQAFGYGKYNVLLYKDYRARGMPSLTLIEGVHVLWKHVMRLPSLSNQHRRARYLRSLGFTLGRIGGSIAFFTWGI